MRAAAYAKRVVKRNGRYRVEPWPFACDKCPQHEREYFGCGWDDRYRGRARAAIAVQGTKISTCPQFYAHSEAYNRTIADLEDYRRGGLGNVDKLASNRLQALRILDSAERDWQADQEHELTEQAKKDAKRGQG